MKLVRETWLLFLSNLNKTLRNPIWVIFGLFQPICWLLLFGPLLTGIAQSPGFPPNGAINVFTPGILIMMALYGAGFVGFGLIVDLREGVVERMRVTPVSRLAPLLALALRDVLVLLFQSMLLLLLAWPLGLRTSLGGVVAAMMLLILLGLMLASCSYALALALKDENALQSTLQFFTVPLLLLSGIMLPLSLAPGWLLRVAAFNPLLYAVETTRALFASNLSGPEVLRGFAITAVLALLALWWAVRSFRQATA